MDAIILAAGRNDRLKGFVPEYMKPLITVNGSPLIITIIRDLIGIASNIIVVVSPQNVGFITEAVEAAFPQNVCRVNYVVQPKAIGTMDAVRRAMPMMHDGDPMIICADNIISPGVYQMVADGLVQRDVSLAVKTIPVGDAERFTYFIEDEVHEKVPAPDGYEEVSVWLGPLALRKGFLFTHADDTESLSGLIALASTVHRVGANCVDIGVPEELP